jgi:hypothetical protein
MSEVAPQSEMPGDKGLTKEFRDSETYVRYRKDILARGIEEKWVDQIIWWFISRPDMFSCEAGQKMMAEFDARVEAMKKDEPEKPDRSVEEDAKAFAAKFSKLLVNEGDEDADEDDTTSTTTVCHDGDHGDRRCESVPELPGLHAPGPFRCSGATAAAAAATASAGVSTSTASAAAAPDQDHLPCVEGPDERGIE